MELNIFFITFHFFSSQFPGIIMSNDSITFSFFPLLYILLQNPRLGTADFAFYGGVSLHTRFVPAVQISAVHKNLYAAYAARASKVCRVGAPHRRICHSEEGQSPDVGISRYDVCSCLAFRWIVPGDCHVAWLVSAMLLAMTG